MCRPNADGLMYATKEEAQKAFKALLTETKISTSWPWDKVRAGLCVCALCACVACVQVAVWHNRLRLARECELADLGVGNAALSRRCIRFFARAFCVNV